MDNQVRVGHVSGVINATNYPLDHKGGGTATAGSSSLVAHREVMLRGILLILPVAAGVVTVVDDAGATIAGLTFVLTAANWPGQYISFDDFHYRGAALAANGATAGIKLSNTATLAANLVYAL